jgi:hypothetical protein
MDTSIEPQQAPIPDDGELARYKAEIRDAQMLLDFALGEASALRENTQVVGDALIASIKAAEQHLHARKMPPVDERTRFEIAYRDLCQHVAPVTVRTLRATSDEFGRSTALTFGRQRSEAIIWSRWLWLLTIAFLSYVILCDVLEGLLIQVPIDEEVDPWWDNFAIASSVLQELNRFAYGGLGACVFLLRSLHVYTYRREFNPDRVPEHLNRILLGVVAGGAISLFVNQVTSDGEELNLSEIALGFLAGYNCDFLFRALERVAEAILPKVGVETVQRASLPAVVGGVSLSDLLDRLRDAQTDVERATIQELIERAKNRI